MYPVQISFHGDFRKNFLRQFTVDKRQDLEAV